MEAYVALESEKMIVENFTTYESAVLGVAKVHKLQRLKRSLNLLLQKVKL